MADASGLPRVPALGSAERELLLACGRLELGADLASRVAELVRGRMDWPAVVWHARLHSVACLLHEHLKDRLEVSGAARRQLLALYHRAAFQNRHWGAEHAAVVDGFAAAGVRTLVPKGLSLVEHVYGSPARRPLIDLVFLIAPRDLPTATSVLRERGYAVSAPGLVDGLYRWCCPHAFFERDDGFTYKVLLQWHLVNVPRLHRWRVADVWAGARPAMVAGRPTLLLPPGDLVLYLCLQADNHGHFNRLAVGRVQPAELLFSPWSNNRLIRFTDLHEVIGHHAGEIDWDGLVKDATRRGLREAAHASLALTQSLLGSALPDGVLEELRDQRAGHAVRRVILEALTGQGGAAADPLRRLVRRTWIGRSGWTQLRLARLIGLLEYSFPPPRRLRERYGIRSPAALALTYGAHGAHAAGRTLLSAAGLAARQGLRRLRMRGRRPVAGSGRSGRDP